MSQLSARRMGCALALVVLIALFGMAELGVEVDRTGAQEPAGRWLEPEPSGIGTHLAAWRGGSVDDLTDIPGVVSIWVTHEGSLVGLVPDAPSSVNSRFRQLFVGGEVPTGTPLLVVIGAPRPAPSATTEALDFAELCVWCAERESFKLRADAAAVQIRKIEVVGTDRDLFVVDQVCASRTLFRGENCEVRVTFQPTRPGVSDASLEISHSGIGGAIVIQLQGSAECERPGPSDTGLLAEAVGFGRDSVGGRDGCLVQVTSLADRGAGTLREAAERPGASWITFSVVGVIELDGYIRVRSDKTIDGRGTWMALEGAGLMLVNQSNVIINDIEIRHAFDDGIQIRGERTTDVWVHHVKIWNVVDGYIDITEGATNVTVSRSRFDPSPDWPEEKVMLIGAGHPLDEVSRVTMHSNYFNGTEQRHPLLRAGTVHSFNNFFEGWGIYGSGVGNGGRLVSERNIYAQSSPPRQHPGRAFTQWGTGSAVIESIGDLFLGGTSGRPSPGAAPVIDYPYTAQPPHGLVETIRSMAGPRP